jgi:hypothetical protein
MLTWYAQEQPTSRMAACVRIVLTGFGIMWTEGQVRMVFGRPRLGITLTAAHARLIHVGARAASGPITCLLDPETLYPYIPRHALGFTVRGR